MTGLPVISLARAEQGDRARIADQISRARTQTGFFAVRDHGIDRKVFDTTYELSLDFFRRPTAERSAPPARDSTDRDDSARDRGAPPSHSARVRTSGRGGPAETAEASGVGRLVLDGTEQMPFPADKRGIALRDALKSYVAACRSVADRVTELLTMAPDPPGAAATPADRSDDSPGSPYHPAEREELLGNRGTGEHPDDTVITLLTEDGPGLQLCDLSGNWIDVDVPGRDWFIVGVGGLRARWSNDVYVSAPRRVGPGDRPQQSIAFFKLANDDAVVESFPKLTRKRSATHVPSHDEQFPPQKTNALFGREEVRS